MLDRELRIVCCRPITPSCRSALQTRKQMRATHPMDPCALVIIGNWISPPEQQLPQQYFCHLECFKAQIGEKHPLYIGAGGLKCPVFAGAAYV